MQKRYKVKLWNDFDIIHDKELVRQKAQDEKYSNILGSNKAVNKLIYDSVLFTKEGITKHAREEMRELAKRGYKIKYVNEQPRNLDEENSFLLKFNDNWDINDNDYATIINQPPPRWERSYGLKNLIGYLAFEGTLIQEWVDRINQSPILELWVPSTYCKDQFITDGVKKPIQVIPHAINPAVWYPPEQEKSQNTGLMTFLWAGTAHNTRKGLDLAVKAFSEQFKDNKQVKLLIKANKIYDNNQDLNKLISNHIVLGGNDNIELCDEDIPEKEFVKLINSVDCVVHPHRSEGFGIIMLQTLACGVPLIATKNTGNMDFCTEDNTIFLETKGERWADWKYPYFNTKWKEPDYNDLKVKLQFAYANKEKLKKNSLEESKKIRKNWTWKNTVDKIEKRLSAMF